MAASCPSDLLENLVGSIAARPSERMEVFVACGNNKVSRSYLTSQPKTVRGLRVNLDSTANRDRSQKQLPRVADAFQQTPVSDHLGPTGGYLRYRSVTGTVRATRIVRVRAEDGTHRSVSIRERVNKQGQITEVLAEEGARTQIRPTHPKDLAKVAPKDRSGDHAHLVLRTRETGAAGARDTRSGLLSILRDINLAEFQPDLSVLGTPADAFTGEDGVPRDVHGIR